MYGLWGLVLITAALEWPQPSLSHFESQRRKAAGDAAAGEELRRIRERPLLIALRRCVVSLLVVGAVAATLAAYGFGFGLAVAAVLALLVQVAARQGWLRRPAVRLEARYHEQLVRFSHRLRPVLKLLIPKARPGEDLPAFASRDELREMLKRDHVLAKQEQQRLLRAMAFPELTVADVMKEWSQVETVEATETAGPLVLDRLHKSGQAAFPVVGTEGRVVGIFQMNEDMPLKRDAATIQKLMHHDYGYIRQDSQLDEALTAFLRTSYHLFIVVNETRGTVGVLSLDQVVDALVGQAEVDGLPDYRNLDAVAERQPVSPQKP